MFKKFSQFILIFAIITSWIFSGWPQIYNFPPKVQEAQAATAGPNSPAAAAGTNWTNPTNVYTDNAVYATYNSTTQDDLKITVYGFAIPANSTISDISVIINGMGAGNPAVKRTVSVGLTKNGSALAGTRQTAAFEQTDGNLAALTGVWGTTWTAAEINASTFGVLIADVDNKADGVFSVDYVSVTITYTLPTTTLATGTNPGNSTIAPGGSITSVNGFTLTTSLGTDAITAIVVNLSTNSGVGTLTITNAADAVLGSIGGGTGSGIITGSNPISISSTNATTGGTAFKVKVTPLSHTDINMPVPPGGEYAITGVVTDWTGSYTKAGQATDTSSTVTIDNFSPAGTTGASATPGDTTVDVGWTPPGDSDFQQVYIYCKTSSMISGEAPTEGTDPTVDGTACDGTVRLKYKGTGSPQTITDLTNNTLYYFRIYARDNNGNFTAYASTQEVSTTPVGATLISISIETGEESFDYGKMNFEAASSTLTLFGGTGITAVNDGNVIETFYINGQNTACPWTLVTGVPSLDQYRHQFCNMAGGCSSYPTNYTAMTTNYLDNVLATDVTASGGTVDFQLRITAPSSTSCYGAQSADITIVAVEQ